jgi:maltose/moltooligosaccharide transporter
MTQPGHKPALSPAQIWNKSFGFLGIQIGFELQNGNVSRIFQTLGADVASLAILWIAAPMTGLIVQPIIGHLSDKTWNPRFRPPAVLISLPARCSRASRSSSCPTRPPCGWRRGCCGSWTLRSTSRWSRSAPSSATTCPIASALPWVMTNWLGLSNVAPPSEIPETVRWSF